MNFKSNILYNKLSDEQLFALAQDGDTIAFNQLFTRYKKKAYIYCFRVLSDQTLAQDAFQEGFMRMYEHRNSFSGKNFMVWFFRILRNTCLNMKRNRKINVEFEHSSVDVSINNTYDDIFLHEYVAKALIQLPEDFREAIVLFEYEGYTYNEIADIVGTSISTVKIRIFRARNLLREILTPIINDYKFDKK